MSGVVLPAGTDELSLAVDVLELEALEAVAGVFALDEELLDCEVVSQPASSAAQTSAGSMGVPELTFMICSDGIFLLASCLCFCPCFIQCFRIV